MRERGRDADQLALSLLALSHPNVAKGANAVPNDASAELLFYPLHFLEIGAPHNQCIRKIS